MTINSYEELMDAVNTRRDEQLVLEVEIGARYSQAHQDAKKALQTAEAMQLLTGQEQQFMSSNLDKLRQAVLDTKPPSQVIFIRYKRVAMTQWALLMKKKDLTAYDQYEEVLPSTFVGVYSGPEETDKLIADDFTLVSSKGDKSILPGGTLHSVVQNFINWQNSGGDVNIRPTQSGQD